MNHKAPLETKDRALALFALAATDTPQATSCPSEETLAQFIDGRLSGQAREAMLAHLNRCRACYHHWLEVAAYLTSSESAAPAPGNTRPAASLWQRLLSWFGDWSIAVPVAASAVVVFALVLWWPRSPDLNAELDLAYAKLGAERAAFAQASLPLPWEGAALGFSESQASAPRRAFGAGLWVGKRALSEREEALPEFLSAPGGVTWPETAWAHYYVLGRWMMLVRSLASSNQDKGDWVEQAAIGQRLLRELSKGGAQPEEEAQRATAALERLQAPLAALEREANPGQPCGAPPLARNRDAATGSLMNASARMTALTLLLLVADGRLGFGQAQQPLARNEVAFYIATHGEVRPEQDPQVANAHRVFERVRAVADKNSKRLPRLVVVNSRADPWAIALPSGHVVLSKEAVAICHAQASLAEAEARLAFVLGHELAHLAHDDFWHQEVYGFLAARAGTRGLADFMQFHQTSKERELAADDKGFIYAAMAGYPVGLLVKNQAGEPDFFAFWMQQTNARVQSVHASAADRAGLLQQRLQDVRNKLGFFEFGVRLSHFDYCDDAVYFFQEFQRTFPGREVLNNLGYCYLQLARQEMGPERAYFYWLPLILDGETRARSLLRAATTDSMFKSLKQATSREGDGFLNQALDYLKQAIDADPSYLPARLNLAVAYLYLGRPQQASAVLAEARELGANDPTLQGLEALALYESSDAWLDLWPAAIGRLEKLAGAPDTPAALVFNSARLLSVRPRTAEARSHWNRLAGSLKPHPLSQGVVWSCDDWAALSSGDQIRELWWVAK